MVLTWQDVKKAHVILTLVKCIAEQYDADIQMIQHEIFNVKQLEKQLHLPD